MSVLLKKLAVLDDAGGTHADLTVKQKKQATAARVAYAPAPRWSGGAALSSAGSDASSTAAANGAGSSVHSGGAPNNFGAAWVSCKNAPDLRDCLYPSWRYQHLLTYAFFMLC